MSSATNTRPCGSTATPNGKLNWFLPAPWPLPTVRITRPPKSITTSRWWWSSATISRWPRTARPRGLASRPGGAISVAPEPSRLKRCSRSFWLSETKRKLPAIARPPPAGASLPPPGPKLNWPTFVPRLPKECISVPSGLKRSMRLWPLLATNSVLSAATATAPTEVNSPGRRPASPISRTN